MLQTSASCPFRTCWVWGMAEDMLTKEAQKELLEVTKRYGRFNWLTKKEK